MIQPDVAGGSGILVLLVAMVLTCLLGCPDSDKSGRTVRDTPAASSDTAIDCTTLDREACRAEKTCAAIDLVEIDVALQCRSTAQAARCVPAHTCQDHDALMIDSTGRCFHASKMCPLEGFDLVVEPGPPPCPAESERWPACVAETR